MKVIYTGSSEGQRNWGSYSGDFSKLVIGKVYEVDHDEVHSYHTRRFLKGVDGSFNSVCFKETPE